jgi:hypothetical protein
MPERGVSTVHDVPTGSHTASAQWQSFEARMRQRRAQRCLLKAHQALEAGLVEEARRACADAREMVPTLPDLAPLEERLAALPARRRHAGLAKAGVGAMVLGAAALMAWSSWTPRPPQLPRHPAQGDIVLAAPVRNPALPSPALKEEPRPPDSKPLVSRDEAGSQPQPREPAITHSALENRASFDPPAAPSLAALEPSSFPAAETTPAPPAPPPAPAPTPAPVRAPTPAPDSGSLTASAPSVTGAVSEPRADHAAIRRTLARYEAAYTDLDASAARAVWPTVDQRALTRAFDGLATQRIALNECDVRVTGGTARATCSGAVTWTAKVGGRQGSEARRWAFDLKNADGSWQIVRAETR